LFVAALKSLRRCTSFTRERKLAVPRYVLLPFFVTTTLIRRQVALLSKLNIRPFAYGLVVRQIYEDGSTYSPAVLDLTEQDMISKFAAGVSRVAALSLQLGYPTLASLPHSLSRAFKNLLAVSLATDYTFEQSKKFKEYLANPSAFAAPAAAADAGAAEEAAPEEEEEEEEESEAEFDLFD
jgi:large subunit ribosomal protein LP0